MGNDRIGETLQAQFDRVWQSLRQTIGQLTDEQLASAPIPWLSPARQAFHIIDSVSAYVDPCPDTWEQSQLSRTWATAPTDELPDRREILSNLNAVEAKTTVWLLSLTSDQWTRDETKIPWAGATTLDRALYALRHTQYHVALIHTELRRLGLPRPQWR